MCASRHCGAAHTSQARSATDDVDPSLAVLERMANDPSAAVRAEVALHLRDIEFADCADALVAVAKAYPAGDRHYLEAVGIGARGKEVELFESLVASTAAGEWSREQADLAWRLHPPGAVSALRQRALAEDLDPQARHQAVDALAFIATREAGEAMLDVALAGGGAEGGREVRELARWWVEHRSENEWREFQLTDQLEQSGLEVAERVYRSPVLRADSPGTVEVDVELADARVLWLVVDDGGDGNACDWADWIEPRFESDDRTWRLVDSEWREAEAEWGRVRKARNCVGDALRIGTAEYEDGIGTHADSRIAFDVPEGAQRFRAHAGPDLGGTSQGATSVVFEVYLETPRDRGELEAWRAALEGGDADREVRDAAIRGLAADAEGGLALIRLATQGELDDDSHALCAELIFDNPDLGVRALASEWFERPGYEESDLPPVSVLRTLPADPSRGRRVFLDERAQCARCHTFRGRGGAIGPDLTAIREKLDVDGLLDAILNPSAGIAHGYDTWLIETTSGVLHSGFILADGEDLILKDTQGKRHVIPVEDVEARYEQKLSTMPAGVALGLDAQELVDLVAFLREDWDREPQYGPEIELFDGETLTGWVHHSTDPEAAADAVWCAGDGVLSCRGTPIGYLRTEREFESFQLSLEWRFDPALGPGNSGVLLRKTGPDKVWPRSIEAQLQHRNAGDIWNIDEFPMLTEHDRLSGRRTAKRTVSNERPLGEWNRYVITLDRGRLVLEVNGVVQNTATWCEELPGPVCLQSEGAAIQFRNIRLRPVLP